MSRFPEIALAAALAALCLSGPAYAGDPAAGEQVFKRCKACHAVGDGAKHRVGPELNELIGRTAGTAEGYRYSSAMEKAGAGGLAWNAETLAKFLDDPKGMVKGTKMSFAGLKKPADIDNVIAYVATFSKPSEAMDAAPKPEDKKTEAAPTEPKEESARAEPVKPAVAAAPAGEGGGLNYHLGRTATAGEIAAWDIDVRPDGVGLPDGSGTVAQGEKLFDAQCSSCHGDFGEAVGRWPVLAGGQGTLKDDRPVKTVGSYWPYLSTVYDYIRRAMPFGNARSLSDDDVYALTAYVLYLNDIVTEEDFELSKANFGTIEMPNAQNFIADDRAEEPQYLANKNNPCMTDCIAGVAKITMHAEVLDVTPDVQDGDDKKPSAGIE
ncbi:MAG: c-type cytochrome [Hyphomicrobiales bacterium]|nr:c-type cytochrome [Hyphomicrobiales bacterium]